MKTTFDQIEILYDILNDSPLKNIISGGIYKLKRPTGSLSEDVVINSLPITTDQIQRGTANVNIYVPDLSVRTGGKSMSMPNVERLGSLALLAVTTLNEYYSQEHAFWLVNQSIIQEPDINQHFINLRIDFRFFPTV